MIVVVIILIVVIAWLIVFNIKTVIKCAEAIFFLSEVSQLLYILKYFAIKVIECDDINTDTLKYCFKNGIKVAVNRGDLSYDYLKSKLMFISDKYIYETIEHLSDGELVDLCTKEIFTIDNIEKIGEYKWLK